MSASSQPQPGQTMTVSSMYATVDDTCPLDMSVTSGWTSIRPGHKLQHDGVPRGSVVIVLAVRTAASFVKSRRSVKCVLPDGTVGWISLRSLT